MEKGGSGYPVATLCTLETTGALLFWRGKRISAEERQLLGLYPVFRSRTSHAVVADTSDVYNWI